MGWQPANYIHVRNPCIVTTQTLSLRQSIVHLVLFCELFIERTFVTHSNTGFPVLIFNYLHQITSVTAKLYQFFRTAESEIFNHPVGAKSWQLKGMNKKSSYLFLFWILFLQHKIMMGWENSCNSLNVSFTNTDTPLLIRLHRQFLFFLPDSPRVSRLAALAGALLPVARR